MLNLGLPELIVIVVLALIVFGPARLPEIGRTVGRVIGDFRQASSDLRRDVKDGLSDGDPSKDGSSPLEEAGDVTRSIRRLGSGRGRKRWP